MLRRFIISALLAGLPQVNHASEARHFPFEDGLWRGDIGPGDGSGNDECRASTDFGDGTTLTLSRTRAGTWHLHLVNPGWRLPSPRQMPTVARVDFYPELRIVVEAESETRLAVEDLDRISLLELIENGHTIDLTADGFHEKYDLEGSAKVIQRLRDCFAG